MKPGVILLIYFVLGYALSYADQLLDDLGQIELRYVSMAGETIRKIPEHTKARLYDSIINLYKSFREALNGVIDGSVAYYEFSNFFWPEATVEVSTLRNRTPQKIPIELYYYRLKSYQKRAGRIYLSSYVEYEIVGTDVPNLWLLKLIAPQHFISKDYKDITIKSIECGILFEDEGSYTIKIEQIKVLQTMDLNEAKNAKIIEYFSK